MPITAKCAARHPPMSPSKILLDRRDECRESGFGNVGEGPPRRFAVETRAQQLHADLEPPLAGPSSQHVERIGEIGRPRQHLAEIGGEPGCSGSEAKNSLVSTASSKAGRCANCSARRGAPAIIRRPKPANPD